MTRFAIAGVQLAASTGDSVEAVARRIAVVAERFPWIGTIVFGELCAPGPDRNAAEPLPGPMEARFRELARKHGVWLVPGSLYERDGKHICISASVVDPAAAAIRGSATQRAAKPAETAWRRPCDERRPGRQSGEGSRSTLFAMRKTSTPAGIPQ